MKPFIKQAIIFGLTIILVIPLFSSRSTTNAAASAASTSAIIVDPQVQAAMNELQPGEMLTVIVTLKDQADLSRIPGASRAARQQGVIRALQAKANATQGRLTGLFNSYQAQGLVTTLLLCGYSTVSPSLGPVMLSTRWPRILKC